LKILNGYSESYQWGEFTFCNRNGSSVIDLCIASQDLVDSMNLKVLDSNESCHFPLMITIGTNIETQLPIKQKCWTTKCVDEKEMTFQGNLENLLDSHDHLDISFTDFTKNMNKAAISCGITKKVVLGKVQQSYGPRWHDTMCQQQKALVHKKLRAMRETHSSSNEARVQYVQARRVYHNLRRAKGTLYENRTIHTLSTSRNSCDLYKALLYFRPKTKPIQRKEHVKQC